MLATPGLSTTKYWNHNYVILSTKTGNPYYLIYDSLLSTGVVLSEQPYRSKGRVLVSNDEEHACSSRTKDGACEGEVVGVCFSFTPATATARSLHVVWR